MKVATLNECATIVMGQSPPSSSYNEQGKGLPLLNGPTEFGEFHPLPKQWTTQPKKECISEDLLFCVRASVGKMNIADQAYCIGRGLAAIRPKGQLLDKLYLRFVLAREVDKLEQRSVGSVFGNVSSSDLKNFQIPLPPLPEQKRIAQILDLADNLRTKRRQALAEVEELTQAVFSEMFGDPTTDNECLGSLVEIQMGYAFKSKDYVESGIPVIRIGDVNRCELNPDKLVFMPVGSDELHKRFVVRPGDVLLSLTGTAGKDDYGNVMTVSSKYKSYLLNQRVAKISPKTENLTYEYLQQFLQHHKVKRRLLKSERGVRQGNISRGDLEELTIKLPSTQAQYQFTQRVAAIEKLKASHQRSLEEMDALFASLQSRAFKGEL